LLHLSERERLVTEVLDETFGFAIAAGNARCCSV